MRTFAVTLQQLRDVLQEYDLLAAPTESMMIRRLRHAIRPEIRASLYNPNERVEDFSLFSTRQSAPKSPRECKLPPGTTTNEGGLDLDPVPQCFSGSL